MPIHNFPQIGSTIPSFFNIHQQFLPLNLQFNLQIQTQSMLFRKLCNSSHTQFFLYRKSPNIFPKFSTNPNFPPKNPILKPKISQNSTSTPPMSDLTRPPAVSISPIETENKLDLFRALEASFGSKFDSGPFVSNPNPLIIVISGPSGVGKDAVIKKLRELREGLHFVVTATSRAMRPGEVDGKDYFFVSKDEFLGMIDKDELLEYALVYGEYKGIPKQQIRDYMAKGCDIVLRVDIQGAATLRKILGRSAVFVFLVAESQEALVKRLIDRKTESKETLLVRIATAKEEVKHVKDFDYVVVNREGELESSVRLMESIIDAEKARVDQRTATI